LKIVEFQIRNVGEPPRWMRLPLWEALLYPGDLISLAISAILLGTVEDIINRNPVSDAEAEWTFGQVLAMVLLFGLACEFFNAIGEANNSDEAEGLLPLR
jgi:hypothetical protein